MKSASIHFGKNLRCRIKATGGCNEIRLTIQKRILFFWVDTDFCKDVSEGYWGENIDIPGNRSPLVIKSTCGHVLECHKTGTLDINNVACLFIAEYLTDQSKKQKTKEHVMGLAQRISVIEGKIRAANQGDNSPHGFVQQAKGTERFYEVAPPFKDVVIDGKELVKRVNKSNKDKQTKSK